MQTGIADSSISSTMASAMPGFSLSKPTMKPAVTNMPAALILWTLSGMLRRVFCFLRICDQRLGIGAFDADEHADEIRLVHQPQQFVVVGEIERGLGGELERIIVLFCHFLRSGRNAFTAFLLPIRLSSTKSTWPR